MEQRRLEMMQVDFAHLLKNASTWIRLRSGYPDAVSAAEKNDLAALEIWLVAARQHAQHADVQDNLEGLLYGLALHREGWRLIETAVEKAPQFDGSRGSEGLSAVDAYAVAGALNRNGDIDLAILLWRRIADRSLSDGHPVIAAACWQNVACVVKTQNDSAWSKLYYERAWELLHPMVTDGFVPGTTIDGKSGGAPLEAAKELVAKVATHFAQSYATSREHARAEIWAERAWRGWEALGEQQLHAKCLLFHGQQLALVEQHQRAIDLLRSAAALLHGLGESEMEETALEWVLKSSRAANGDRESADLYRLWRDLAKSCGNDRKADGLRIDYALSLIFAGRYEQAEAELYAALGVSIQKQDLVHTAAITYNIGKLAMRRLRFDEAERRFEEAKNLWKKADVALPSGVSEDYEEMAILRDYATNLSRQQYVMGEKLPEPSVFVARLVHLSISAAERRDFVVSLAYARRAETIVHVWERDFGLLGEILQLQENAHRSLGNRALAELLKATNDNLNNPAPIPPETRMTVLILGHGFVPTEKQFVEARKLTAAQGHLLDSMLVLNFVPVSIPLCGNRETAMGNAMGVWETAREIAREQLGALVSRPHKMELSLADGQKVTLLWS